MNVKLVLVVLTILVVSWAEQMDSFEGFGADMQLNIDTQVNVQTQA